MAMAPPIQALRFMVVAHASPRWRSATSPADADKRNLKLSEDRKRNVQAVVERILRDQIGPRGQIQRRNYPVVIPEGVEVGGVAVGSKESIVASKGDRQNNDKLYRKVDVVFERFIMSTVSATVSTGQESAKIRKWWGVRVEHLNVHFRAAQPNNAAYGDATLTLTNDLTNKSALAKVTLVGIGSHQSISLSPNPYKQAIKELHKLATMNKTDHYSDNKGVDHAFGCNREMGFRDFNGQTVSFHKRTYSAGLKGHTMYMEFNGLGNEASNIVLPTVGSLGGLGYGGYSVVGKLQLIEPIPDDWIDQAQTTNNDFVERDGYTLTLYFPNEKGAYSDIPFLGRSVFESHVKEIGRLYARYLANSSPFKDKPFLKNLLDK
jgi:hypothetical protein